MRLTVMTEQQERRVAGAVWELFDYIKPEALTLDDVIRRMRADATEVNTDEMPELGSRWLLARIEPAQPEAPQEAPMKCLECGGKGFIEHNYGLIQAQCTACHGIGTLPDAEEASNADIDHGIEQPDKPARKPYTRKSTKPRKRPKSRKA